MQPADYRTKSKLAWSVQIQFIKKLNAIRAEFPENHKQLDNIQPAFSKFVLTHKRRWLPKALRQLSLGQTRFVTGLDQLRKQMRVSSGMDASSQFSFHHQFDGTATPITGLPPK